MALSSPGQNVRNLGTMRLGDSTDRYVTVYEVKALATTEIFPIDTAVQIAENARTVASSDGTIRVATAVSDDATTTNLDAVSIASAVVGVTYTVVVLSRGRVNFAPRILTTTPPA